MNEPGKVYESFEDALFRLILDRVAAVEGERLLRENEALKNDPDAAVPEDVQKRCLKAALSRSGRKKAARAAQKVIRAAALAALIALLLGVVAFATIPAFHDRVLNVFMIHEKETVDWEFDKQPKEPHYEVSFTIPDGYLLTKQETDSYSDFRVYTKANDPEAQIQIQIFHINEGTRISIDAEDLDYYEEIMIHENYPGIITEKEGFRHISWADTAHACHIAILSNRLSRDELVQMAESVQFT